MTKLSATFSYLILLVLALCTLERAPHWHEFQLKDRLLAGSIWIYTVMLVVSARFCNSRKSRTGGFLHAALMLGGAGFCLYSGLSLFSAGSGHHTPDAVYAVDGITQIMGLAVCLLGTFAAICGIGVLRCLFMKPQKNETVA